MQKVKNVILIICKSLVIMLGGFSTLIVVFSLGDRLNTTTMIGTIFGPIIYPYLIILLLILILIQIGMFIWNKKSKNFISKLSVAALIASIIPFISISLAYHTMCNAVRKAGGNISIFDTFSSSLKTTDDEKVIYANHDDQDLTISIYHNEKKNDETLKPIYVYIHGGGWTSNNSETDGHLHRAMADEGYLTFSINYRLCTDEYANWEDSMNDIAEAMNWIYDHASEYGGDKEHILLCGESAGGHLVLLYTGLVSSNKLDAPKPSAVGAMYPVVDLKWTSENGSYLVKTPGIVEKYIGGNFDEYPDRLEFVSPLNYVNENMPPILIIHGKKDTLVGIEGSKKYIQELNKVGVKNKLVEIPLCNHGTLGNKSLILNFIKDIDGLSIK